MLKAIKKDDAFRCPVCETEVWEGTDCECGLAWWVDENSGELFAEKENAE